MRPFLILAALLGGCASSPEAPLARSGEVVLADFVAVEDDPPAVVNEENPPSAGPRFPLEATAGGGDGFATRRGARLESGERLVVDSLVGQINGRPIFADQFLSAIEDELIAEAERVPDPRTYAQIAGNIVATELRTVWQNALILAEAESSLTQEEQQGLFYAVQQLGEQEVARKGGSLEQARLAVEREENMTFDEYLQGKRDEHLIRRLINDHVRSRVIVSWRDIERAYAQRYDEYNPPGQVTLSRIRLRASDEERAATVTEQLAGGTDFGVIAAEIGRPWAGTWGTFAMTGEGIGTIDATTDEQLLAALSMLEAVGDVAGPIETGGRTWWIHVDAVSQPPARSLFDPQVQRELRAIIFNQRASEEQFRYMESLSDQGITDDIGVMGQRLLEIAILRYGP